MVLIIDLIHSVDFVFKEESANWSASQLKSPAFWRHTGLRPGTAYEQPVVSLGTEREVVDEWCSTPSNNSSCGL